MVSPLTSPPSHMLTAASQTEDFLVSEEKHQPWAMGGRPTKFYYPPMTSCIQTYAQRIPTVQHLMLYLLQTHTSHPDTLSPRSTFIEISLKSIRNFPKTFFSHSNFLNHSETIPKHQGCFSTILKSSETLPSALGCFPRLSPID